MTFPIGIGGVPVGRLYTVTAISFSEAKRQILKRLFKQVNSSS